jgi:GNAT superfamily N-acetyltransferase
VTGLSDVEVVEYDDRWEAAQTAFAHRNWPGKARRADPAYIRWEYRGPASGPVPGVLLAVAGDEVVGQLGMIPGEARIDDEVQPIQWIGNLMVDPAHRRRGVSTAIFDAALRRPVITLGTDPSPSAAATLPTFGFSRADSSELMVLPLAAGAVITTRHPQLGRASRLLDVVGAPALRYVTRLLRAAQRADAAQVCTWADVVDDVLAAEAEGPGPRSLHDEAFLRWRCGGFAPWVREADAVRTPDGSFALLERAGDRLLVLHWHATAPADAAAVMGRVVYVAESYGVSYVQAMAIDDGEVARLAALGFRARRTPTDLWCHPGGALGGARFAVQGYDTDQNL